MLLLDSLAGAHRAVLVLTAGGKQINCDIARVDDDDLRKAWKRRCVVHGLAHYSGKTGLPELLDISAIRTIESSGAIQAWQGAFDLPAPDDSIWD